MMPHPVTADPIDHATAIIAAQVVLGADVIHARQHDPTAYPAYGETPRLTGMARRAVAELLNEGWAPPSTPAEEGTPT